MRHTTHLTRRRPARLIALAALLALFLLPQQARGQTAGAVTTYDSGLNHGQMQVLYTIARQTWKFYSVDVDPTTHLPMDNIGLNGAPPQGKYTSAANIGVYLWAVVSAMDLGLINRAQADSLVQATLTEVNQLDRYNGFLYQWYDTTNGHRIRNPGDIDCSQEPTPTYDNCYFISQVDNGWFASGLIIVRNALPELAPLANGLISQMNFGIFYDNGPENDCNVYNGNPSGQMYGGYYAGLGPAGYHNGAFYSDPRISAYVGMGLHQMPGNVWWRTWRVLPPKAPYDDCAATDPDFSWTGQGPGTGYWHDYQDPQSGKTFHVWEGHYTYPPDSSLTFIPTWAGGMFEAEMANQVVPETSWGPRSFGLADLREALVQMRYATEQLHYPVWGMSPSSTPDDTGNYDSYGVTGLAWPYPEKKGLSQCYACGANGPSGSVMEDAVTPHASFLALDVLPQAAFKNIQALRSTYPDIYGPYGFFDAVAVKDFQYNSNCNAKGCTTYTVHAGQVGHRYLVLDQSMIMAALDNALNNRQLQRYFAQDPASWAARTYLGMETMSIAG